MLDVLLAVPAMLRRGVPSQGTMTADLHIYRSALNSDEVASLWAGNTYQSSLEVWAPLTGAEPPTTNLAQSMTALRAA